MRIGLDYDTKDVGFVRSVLCDIILEFSPGDLSLFVSPSGRGYHVWFSVGDFYTDADLLEIRKEYGDDPNRISIVDGYYRDVLFDVKCVDGVIMKSKRLDLDKFLFCGEEVLYDG